MGIEIMEATKAKPSRTKAILILAIMIVAAVAGAYYYVSSHAPAQFTMTVSPPFFHAAAGGGFLLFILVNRVAGFASNVSVTLVNTPSWISSPTLVLNSTSLNGTMAVPLSNQATKGSYQLTVVGTAPASAPQTVTVSLKVVGVTSITNQFGSATVYDTTKALDAPTLAALVSFANNTFQFSHSTPQLEGLEPGDVIAASFNQTSILPYGFLRTVLNVRMQSGTVFVDTRIASLLEAAEDIQLGSGNGSAGSSGTSVASTGLHPNNAIDACHSLSVCKSIFGGDWNVNAPLDNAGDAKFTLSGAVEFAVGGGGHIHWVGLDWLVLGVFATVGATASIVGKAGDQLQYNNNDIATLGHADIEIFGPILTLHIELDVAGKVFGTLLEDVNAQVNFPGFDAVFAATYNANQAPSAVQNAGCSAGGWNLCTSMQPNPAASGLSIGLPEYPGSSCASGPSGDCARIEIGPELTISIDGNILNVVKASGGVNGELWLFFELDTHATFPVWSLYTGLGASLGISLSAGIDPCFGILGGCYIGFNYSPSWNLPDFVREDIKDAGNGPPSTPVLIILNSVDTLDLSTIGIFPPGPINGWGTTMGPEPEGEPVTCIWMSKEVGQIGTSKAAGNSLLACPGPSWTDLPIDQIISKGLTSLSVYVIAQDSAGAQSLPSNTVTVKVILPAPVLYIESPQNSTTLTEGTPFYVKGSATVATSVSAQYPNGINDLCQSEPQNLVWYVGGMFQADLVDLGGGGSGGGWVGAAASGTGCIASLTIPSSGQTSPYQTTIYFVLGAVDPQTGNWYIPQASEGTYGVSGGTPVSSNVAVATVNVQPAPPTQVTTAAVAAPTVQITSPSSGSSYVYLQSVPLQGTVSGGTPPYTTATWTAQNPPYSYTIASGPTSSTLSYQWAFGPNAGCNALDITGTASVVISLSVTDSAGQTGTSPGSPPFTITLNCAVVQTIQPISVPALASLLSVLFAVTSERVIPRLQKEPAFLYGKLAPN